MFRDVKDERKNNYEFNLHHQSRDIERGECVGQKRKFRNFSHPIKIKSGVDLFRHRKESQYFKNRI